MAPMKTVPVFGGNAVNLRRNEVFSMWLPPGGSWHEVPEGERGTDSLVHRRRQTGTNLTLLQPYAFVRDTNRS